MGEENGLATAAMLLAVKTGRRYKEVDLPVCELKVRIQSITEHELAAYQGETLSKRGGGTSLSRNRMADANRRLIVLCLVDAAGNRLLHDSHVKQLAEWDAADTQSLYDECATHCGINTRDIEDLAKNSAETIGDEEPLTSPET